MLENANRNKPLLEPLPLYERVYLSIKQAILNGDFKPGERLTDQRLSSFLGVSSTPVREAVKLLVREGLLAAVPNKGVSVFNPSPRDVAELYAIRSLLEGFGAYLAAQNVDRQRYCAQALTAIKAGKDGLSQGRADIVSRANTDFHDLIISASECQHLQQLLASLRDKAIICRSYSMKQPDHRLVSLEEHEEILAAIMTGEAEKSETLVRQHIYKAGQRVLRQMGAPGMTERKPPIFHVFNDPS